MAAPHKNIIPAIIFCLPPLLALAPFFYAFAFCHPAGDDFDEAARAMFLFDLPGALYETGREWITWSGRYSYHFLAVFLGRAAENPVLDGLVCLSSLCLYGVAAYLLARLRSTRKILAFCFAGLSLFAVIASWRQPQVFYLLTDALTIVLQGGAFLLFLALLCSLWQWPENARLWKLCLISGIFAIGIYEHASLAVICAAFLALLLSFLESRRIFSQKVDNPRRLRNNLKLVAWLLPALAFSFFAPGNFSRQKLRGIGEATRNAQLADAGNALLAVLREFCHSPWPWLAICLALFIRFAEQKEPSERTAGFPFRAFLLLAVFILFSLAVSLLHAQSDAPLGSAPKLGASLCFYAAVTLVFIIHDLLAPLTNINNIKFRLPAAFFCMALCIGIGCSGNNFQKTAINAVNGQLLFYGQAMRDRFDYLRSLSKREPDAPPKFGLAGEYLRGGKRRSPPDPAQAHAIVPAFTESAFPVRASEDLKTGPDSWPNNWAAWLYDLYDLRVQLPDPAWAICQWLKNPAGRLPVPPALRDPGINACWRVSLPVKGNAAFYQDWLILEAGNLSAPVAILRPNPPDWKRLAPISMQKHWLSGLLAQESVPPFQGELVATKLVFEPAKWRHESFYAFPLGSVKAGESGAPAEIFLGIGGERLYRMQ